MSPFDAAVVGRGAIGSAAALAFARAGWRVALVGPGPEVGSPDPLIEGALPWDSRVYALSPASRQLLQDLDVWPRIDPARVAPVYDMRLFHEEAGRAPSSSVVHLDAYRGRVEALAWIVENRNLQQALDSAIADAAPTMRLSRIDAEVDGLTLPEAPGTRRAAVLGLAGGGRLTAHLVVAADGTRSPLRDLAGIEYVVRDYDQTAVVANFDCERPHRDCAWQWFGRDGIAALLPLPSATDGSEEAGWAGRVSLVWSAPIGQAADALRQPPAWLEARVRALSHDTLGRLRMITPPAAFPLRTVRCRQVIRPSFVLIGDAAHAVHPMAGQGMNLGFGDVRGLMDHLLARPRPRSAAAAAPDWLVLRRYERSRREPVAAMQFALDGLHRAFGDLPAPLVGLRDLGWQIVARSPWLKRRMIAHAVS